MMIKFIIALLIVLIVTMIAFAVKDIMYIDYNY